MAQTKTKSEEATREGAPAMAERDHLEGCPELDKDEADRRVEISNPPDKRNRPVPVVRCVTCGGQRVLGELVEDDEETEEV